MLNKTQTHWISVGDTLTPLGAALKQSNKAVVLTGKSVEFKLVRDDGQVVQDWTADGVTIVDETAGKVQYDFQPADVNEAGNFYGFFRVGLGGEWDTFPPDGRRLRITITAAA